MIKRQHAKYLEMKSTMNCFNYICYINQRKWNRIWKQHSMTELPKSSTEMFIGKTPITMQTALNHFENNYFALELSLHLLVHILIRFFCMLFISSLVDTFIYLNNISNALKWFIELQKQPMWIWNLYTLFRTLLLSYHCRHILSEQANISTVFKIKGGNGENTRH